jgi:hypothetical protein
MPSTTLVAEATRPRSSWRIVKGWKGGKRFATAEHAHSRARKERSGSAAGCAGTSKTQARSRGRSKSPADFQGISCFNRRGIDAGIAGHDPPFREIREWNGKHRPEWVNRQIQSENDNQIVCLGKSNSRLDEAALEVFLNALLTVKADRIVPGPLSGFQKQQYDVVIAFGLVHPFERYRKHRARSPSP